MEEAIAVINHTHERWVALKSGEAEHDADFWLGPVEAVKDGWGG